MGILCRCNQFQVIFFFRKQIRTLRKIALVIIEVEEPTNIIIIIIIIIIISKMSFTWPTGSRDTHIACEHKYENNYALDNDIERI